MLLPLDDGISHALIEQNGNLGEVLKLVTAYEKGDWANIDASSINIDTLRKTYLDSLSWSAEIIHQIKK